MVDEAEKVRWTEQNRTAGRGGEFRGLRVQETSCDVCGGEGEAGGERTLAIVEMVYVLEDVNSHCLPSESTP